ncbi:MAG TPA: DMT family transporter [Tissierellia bacterium]|nr:DMT family transporter [Tissierellia bacterium]
MDLFKRKPIAIAAAILASFFWGSAYPLLKVTYQVFEVAPSDVATKLLLAGLRFMGAGLIVLLLKRLFRIPRSKQTLRDWRLAALLGFLGVTIQYSFFYIGVGNTSASKSAIIQSSSIFMILVISTMILRIEKLRLIHVLSMLLGFGGILVANLSSGGLDFDFRLTGEGLLLGSSLTVALTTLLVKQRGSSASPFFFAAWQMILGSIPLLVFGLLATPGFPLSWYGLSLVGYGAFLSGAAFTLWYSVITVQSVVEMSFYRLFIPVFGTLLSAIVLNEPMTIQIVVGLLLVISGSFLLQFWQRHTTKLRRKT